uniref:pentapeptide repeat-containing protein n=1 Tax=Nonomuraea pusilla TaxID=46177 RepID=UPI0009E70921
MLFLLARRAASPAHLPVCGPHVAHSDRISVEDHLQTIVRVFLEIDRSVVYNIVREFDRHRVRFADLIGPFPRATRREVNRANDHKNRPGHRRRQRAHARRRNDADDPGKGPTGRSDTRTGPFPWARRQTTDRGRPGLRPAGSQGAGLRPARVRRARLRRARLRGAQLRGARFRGARFRGA